MDAEIDLSPYLRAITRRWLLILALVVVLVLIAGVVTFAAPRPAYARADVFIFPRNPEVSLDPRFADRDANFVTNQTLQRQALIELSRSGTIEARVASRMGMTSHQPGALLGRIEVAASSDLLYFVASGPTETDAIALAEAWAFAYQELVGELYSGAESQIRQIEVDLAEANQRFDEVQVEIDSFYADGELVRAEQQLLRLEGLLDGGAEAQVSLYTNYLTRTRELSLILEDARALQAQYEGGRQPDLGASLAALAVRARLAGGEQLPVQLSFASVESFTQGQVADADLARFVAVLATERDRIVAEADALAQDLAAGDTSAVGLPAEVRARYEEELATARGALARAEGEEEFLLQRRTLALTSLQVLQSRADELRIDQSQVQVGLRVVGVAPEPPRSRTLALVLNLGAAALVGLVLGTIIALMLELLQRRRGPASAQVKSPITEPIGRTPASD